MREEEVRAGVGMGGPSSWMLTWVTGWCLGEGIQGILLAQPGEHDTPRGTRL